MYKRQDLDPEQIDMFTVVLIGNSQTYLSGNHMITPRGYYGEVKQKKTDTGIGQDIMIRSFRTIEKELKNQEIPLDKKWALLHAIHTTADFDMEDVYKRQSLSCARWREFCSIRFIRLFTTGR